MPIKCSFCRRKYARAGPYEKHLRTAHADLCDLLASCRQRRPPGHPIHDTEPLILPQDAHAQGKERADSDYESDQDTSTGRYEPSTLSQIAPESPVVEANVITTSSVPREPTSYPSSGESIGDVRGFQEELRNLCGHPWAPFASEHGFKLASWFIEGKVSKGRINEYFSSGLGNSSDVGYRSMYTLEKHLRELDPYGQYLQWFEGKVEDGMRILPFFYRNILDCVRYLLRQIAYRDDFVYSPRREYDPQGERIYAEMHTADWWWDVQETLPHGATVVPIIGMSDQTHLTNFSGDKKAWPVYITIGNLPSNKRNKPGSMAVLLLALLPVPPKLPQSSSANNLQREVNADTLQGVFDLIFAPLQDAALEGVPIDCADGRVRKCFPILSAWIADHMENVALHGVKSNACPTCEISSDMLGSPIQDGYRTRDYASYDRLEQEIRDESGEIHPHDVQTRFDTLGVKVGRNVFHGMQRVSVPDLHKPDLLHTVYLGLFKHMMDWVQAFLKKHLRLQAFDDAWKALPPYPGFFVPKKAYREVTQWQGKEMRNLGRCLLGVLAVALKQPDSAQALPFKRALTCVRSLLDFSMIAQYRSHTQETIGYMEQYLDRFHATKDVFLEFRVSKRTLAKVDDQRRELRQQRTDVNRTLTGSNRRRVHAQDRDEENSRRIELIHAESHFNFIKMHLLYHFRDHIYKFGNIPMYSTEFGELAHKDQIKDGWRRSNKNDAARQILHSYGRQHAIRMRLLNLEALRCHGARIPADPYILETPIPESELGIRRRRLKGRQLDVANLRDICMALDISIETMCLELIRYSRQSLAMERRLPEDRATIQHLPIEMMTHLEIPVLAFQENDVYDIHRARSTGVSLFRNQACRNDWVWVQAGGEEMYGALCGWLPAKLIALIKLRDYRDPSRVY